MIHQAPGKRLDQNERVHILLLVLAMIVIVTFTAYPTHAQTEWPQVATSNDGVPISYEMYGSGEPTLVFVHGWSCDSRYWRNQIQVFSKKHKIVLLDLAGHGHSGGTRETYSMKAFGEDVQAVIEATGSQNVILIGHSMGGAIIAKAAKLMPDRIKGLIGVDTYHNVEYELSQEQFDMMIAPLRQDFKSGARQFVLQMFAPDADAASRDWIVTDMSAAPPEVALSAMHELMTASITGEAANIFDDIRIPIMAVNADMWPTGVEANRQHMSAFDAIVLKGTDHFLMINHPDEFNKALKQAIKVIVEKEGKK